MAIIVHLRGHCPYEGMLHIHPKACCSWFIAICYNDENVSMYKNNITGLHETVCATIKDTVLHIDNSFKLVYIILYCKLNIQITFHEQWSMKWDRESVALSAISAQKHTIYREKKNPWLDGPFFLRHWRPDICKFPRLLLPQQRCRLRKDISPAVECWMW